MVATYVRQSYEGMDQETRANCPCVRVLGSHKPFQEGSSMNRVAESAIPREK